MNNHRYSKRFDYTNRFSRLRNNIQSNASLKNSIDNNIDNNKRREFFKDNLENFKDVTKLVDMLNDSYKRESMVILERLEEINKNRESKLEIPNMKSTMLVLRYLVQKIEKFSS
tara:strand:+ start:374 stop:715 length:342 start_codon:yes stop_codon:yes gene_type:complete